jgi:IclR family pca regulon transcriptional regulator
MARAIAKKTEGKRDWYVESLVRGLMVLRSFDAGSASQRIIDVAKRTGLSRAASRRLLMTLQDAGYLDLEDDRYTLRPAVLDLGFSYLATLKIPALAQPVLAKLVSRFGEAASVAILDDTQTLHIARAAEGQKFNNHIPIGSRLPAYISSLGRVLLAALPEPEMKERVSRMHFELMTPQTISSRTALLAELKTVRQQGWAATANQVREGIGGIAVPIRDRHGSARAAINLHRLVEPGAVGINPEPYLIALQQAAVEISLLLDS